MRSVLWLFLLLPSARFESGSFSSLSRCSEKLLPSYLLRGTLPFIISIFACLWSHSSPGSSFQNGLFLFVLSYYPSLLADVCAAIIFCAKSRFWIVYFCIFLSASLWNVITPWPCSCSVLLNLTIWRLSLQYGWSISTSLVSYKKEIYWLSWLAVLCQLQLLQQVSFTVSFVCPINLFQIFRFIYLIISLDTKIKAVDNKDREQMLLTIY